MADTEYNNELRGALFKAKEKKSDKSPDYTGSCQINGVELWVSGWLKNGRSGNFLSLAFSVKDEQKPTMKHIRGADDDGFMASGGGEHTGGQRERQGGTTGAAGRASAHGTGQAADDKEWDDDIPFSN